jgi:hypothetical protein
MPFSKLALKLGGKADEIQHFPFEISVATDEVGPYATLRPGTINNFLPTNMFDLFDIEETGTFYVTLDIDTDGDSITGAEINVDSELPDSLGESAIGVAPDYFQILIGIIVDKKPFNVLLGSIYAYPQETIQTLKYTAEPGTPYYDINYTWGYYTL